MDAHSFLYNQKMREVKAYMRESRFPRHLQRRVRRHYEYFLAHKSLFDEARILDNLSTNLRNRLVRDVYKQHISTLHIFRGISSSSFIVELVTKLKPFHENKVTDIGTEGSTGEEVFCIVAGTIEG